MPALLRTALLLALALPAAAIPAAPAAAAIEDEIIVQRAPGLDAAERSELREDASVQLKALLSLKNAELVVAEDGDRATALRELNADPDVLWAEPNLPRRAFTADPHWSKLWGLENSGQYLRGVTGFADADIDANEAWITGKGAGALVAVADTGAQLDHPDLALAAGRDFVDGDTTPADGNGHGTHVAGTIAALENTTGVVGVAPAARVMPLRVLGNDGYGSSSAVTQAFSYAGSSGVRIVNASLGSGSYSRAEYETIRAYPNTLFVVAAGNDGVNTDSVASYPCNYPLANIVCVGASDQRDAQASFSNYSATHVDLHAPGVNILSTYTEGRYAWLDGTSMATPHVAGAAAVLAAARPDLTAAQLKQALLDGADRVAALSGRSVTGARLNLAGALRAAGAAPAPTSPATPAADPAPEPAAAQPQPQAPATPAPAPAAQQPAAPVHTVPAPAPSEPWTAPAPAPQLAALRITGKPRICARGCKTRSGRLTFRLSQPSRVAVQLQRRSAKRWRSAGRTTLRLEAGAHRLTVGTRLAGLRLRAGQWRVQLATSADAAQANFTIAAR